MRIMKLGKGHDARINNAEKQQKRSMEFDFGDDFTSLSPKAQLKRKQDYIAVMILGQPQKGIISYIKKRTILNDDEEIKELIKHAISSKKYIADEDGVIQLSNRIEAQLQRDYAKKLRLID